MKYASLTATHLAFLSSIAMAACAVGSADVFGDGGHSPGGDGGASGVGGGGAAVGGGDAGLPTDDPDSGGKVCAPDCKKNLDCQTSCAAAPSGSSNCCNTMTGDCYTNAAATCPAPPGTSSSTGSSMYP